MEYHTQVGETFGAFSFFLKGPVLHHSNLLTIHLDTTGMNDIAEKLHRGLKLTFFPFHEKVMFAETLKDLAYLPNMLLLLGKEKPRGYG